MTRLYETAGVLTQVGGGLKNSDTKRMLIKLISAGQGSSGFYRPRVLKESAEAGRFPAGTHMYVDHPTVTEKMERPERSITTLAAVLAEDGYWDEAEQAVMAPADVYSAYRAELSEMKDHIGVSIVAEGMVDTDGIVESIDVVKSVDFVTKPGRGGKIVEIIESARARMSESDTGSTPDPGDAPDELTEATSQDVMGYLQTEIQSAHGDVAVMDYDQDQVYYRSWSDGKVFAQGYTLNGVNVSLEGSPSEVRAETSYTPVGTSITESGGATSPTNVPTEGVIEMVEITEAEHTAYKSAQELAESLAAQNAALRESLVRSTVDSVFDGAGVEAPKGREKLISEAVSREELDLESFRAEIEEAVNEYAPAGPNVQGFGETTPIEEKDSGMSRTDYEEFILSGIQEAGS